MADNVDEYSAKISIENIKKLPIEKMNDIAESLSKIDQEAITHMSTDDKNNFKDLLWYTYQKVYEYVYLDDFVRYVCLSAISRADSEWPLSLVDFRSVLELQIKSTFHEIVQKYIYEQNYSLANIINELKARKLISGGIANAMHKIRKSGNAATHQMKLFDDGDENNYWNSFDKDDSNNLNYLLTILEFFNNYNRENNIKLPD